ncbi:MAG: hypothetical protein ACOX7J_02715 [Bacillota bacterium]|jgi:hypothetical protein
MYGAIKEIAERCVQANTKVGFKVATVKNSSELVLDQGLILPVEPCFVLENAGGIKIKVDNTENVLKRQIQVGDKLLLLNIGNEYCVLDRIGSLFDSKVLQFTSAK